MKQYSETIKESILAKLLTPNGSSVVDLSKEFNIPLSTIYLWVAKMNKNNLDKNPATKPASKQSTEYKRQAIADTYSMTVEERGAYCRQHGIFTSNILEWMQESITSAAAENVKAKVQQPLIIENKKLKSDMLRRDSEILRKDKALAEVSALLILKKKADLLWGLGNEED